MNGNLWYEVARQRVAERQRGRPAGRRGARGAAAARARRARDRAQATTVAPVIPDYAHEMFAELGDAVPASRQEPSAAAGRAAGPVARHAADQRGCQRCQATRNAGCIPARPLLGGLECQTPVTCLTMR